MQHPHYAPEPFDPKASRPGQPVIVDPRVDHPTRLTDPEDNDETALLPVWRLSRAPMQAKLIKFADIIDNAARKRAHAPHEAFKAWADEKALILERMIEVDVSRLAEQPLFQRARTAITSP